MKKLRTPFLLFSLLPMLSLTSCDTPGQGAATGAMVGGAVGSVVAANNSYYYRNGRYRGYHYDYGTPLAGAAIGAAAGALVGLLVQEDRRRVGRQYDDLGEIPKANRTDQPGFVESPYKPYNLIDVRGIPRGAKVMDPSTEGVFINP